MSHIPSPRVQAIERAFTNIAHTRLSGVPVLNPALHVQAIGFGPEPDDADMLLGVLVTPWFMNLVRLPTLAAAPGNTLLAVGQKGIRAAGNESFEFVGACEADLGAFEVCSLFSPMFQFANHAAATDTANEVLNQLRTPVKPTTRPTQTPPSRRGFLFGRGTAPTQAHT